MKLGGRVTPRRAARLFALSNVAFLAVDIALAHATNAFAHPAEWAPIVFSSLAALLLLPGACGSDRPIVIALERMVGWGSITVGVVGMIFHLESSFFAEQTLKNLVYSAPFIAPLSYVGVGLLVLLLRSSDPAVAEVAGQDGPAFGLWTLVLALGGFIGNFGLSVFDHAQNGFAHVTEWIPVASAALGIGALVVVLARPTRENVRLAAVVMGLQVLVGLAGFALHVDANVHAAAASKLDRFVYGAPAFAPLLFADIALLAGIGLWSAKKGDST